MHIKLNELQWIGVGVSAIWFHVFAEYYLHGGTRDVDKWLGDARQSCDGVLQLNNDFAIALERKEDRSVKVSENRAEWIKCRESARKKYDLLAADPYEGSLPLLFALDLGTIGFGWLIAWFVIVIARWIKGVRERLGNKSLLQGRG